MKIPMFQVDAFTRSVFGGNPAAVCLLDLWPDDEIMQNIAAENNLSETAFLVKKDDGYDLRWFTPKMEIDLCGHATLASAFVIFKTAGAGLDTICFETKSGILTVEKSGDLLSMNFPARKPVETGVTAALTDALGAAPVELFTARDHLAIFENETQVRQIQPDFMKILALKDTFAVIVSAPGDHSDFVSRFFTPKAGVPEDPVTGSAHCTLVPFWSERLGKKRLHAFQVSERGGELFCEDLGDRVKISGHAVLFSKGEIYI